MSLYLSRHSRRGWRDRVRAAEERAVRAETALLVQAVQMERAADQIATILDRYRSGNWVAVPTVELDLVRAILSDAGDPVEVSLDELMGGA